MTFEERIDNYYRQAGQRMEQYRERLIASGFSPVRAQIHSVPPSAVWTEAGRRRTRELYGISCEDAGSPDHPTHLKVMSLEDWEREALELNEFDRGEK